MKKSLAVMLVVSLLTLSVPAFAGYNDVPKNADYTEAVERIVLLGLMDKTGDNTFSPDEYATRAEFAKLIVIAAGLSDEAEIMKGTTLYSDVPADNTYNGYINAAVGKGLMTGLADGKFHPDDPVTYAQSVTGMLRALGYSDNDIPGVWPKNYIEKAKALGLTQELSYSAGAGMPRWAIAQMTDYLLDMKVKASGAQDGPKTLAEASALTTAAMYSVYSKPQVYYKSALKGTKLGSIDLSGKLRIVRNSVDNNTNPATVTNGEEITPDEIDELNVVYEVSDKFGINKYVLVIDNQITGTITGILPNKFLPRSVEIDGISYELDDSFDVAKLTGDGSFSLNDSVMLLLGYDGKVVDIQGSTYEDNSNFAFVMNYTVPSVNSSINIGSTKKVKLLLTNGQVKTFTTTTDPTSMKGRVVTYAINTDGTVTLTKPGYPTINAMTVDKSNRKMMYGSNYFSNDVSSNVKIFSLISSGEDTYEDAEAELVSWSEMPSGILQTGKVIFLNKAGIFEDINVIFINNIKANEYYLGVVKRYNYVSGDEKPYKYTITVGVKDYTYNSDTFISNSYIDNAVKVTLSGNTISSIIEAVTADTYSTVVQAADENRIRVNSKTYRFSDKTSIYNMEYPGNPVKINVSQLWNEAITGTVYIYTDISYNLGGKAELIIIKRY